MDKVERIPIQMSPPHGRGVAGTTKVGGGGGGGGVQTPRKLQAPVFLVLFVNHKTHLTSAAANTASA